MALQQRAEKLNTAQWYCERACTLWNAHSPSPQDRTRAVELWLYAVTEFDHVPSACYAARAFDVGAQGIPRDARRAKKLYERAASAGNAFSMYRLAILLSNGAEGVERDPVRAKDLYEGAATAGNVDAMLQLGYLLRVGAEGIMRDAARAKELYERAAAVGNVDAMVNLANLLLFGAKGVEIDAVRAKELYERAASAGDVNAMYNLAMLLGNGASGVERDVVRAKQLTENAATHSSWEGFVRRAQLLSFGDENTPRNESLALDCYEKALQLATKPWQNAMVRTEFARFLLSRDRKAHHGNTQRAIGLLEEAVRICPYRETLSELINIYSHCIAAEFRNQQRAAELKEITPFDGYRISKRGIVRHLEEGGNTERLLLAVMHEALVTPRSCLLMALGGPGRGKTATLNSLRGRQFVSQHIPTEMAEMSQFVTEPGVRGLDENKLDDLDFRENSFRAITSRISTSDVAGFERSMPTNLGSRENVEPQHKDVLERLRQGLTYPMIPSKWDSWFVRCWDMGGQSEYEMAHSLFIGRADIFLFVANLERVRNESTREEEVTALCYWMQLGYALMRNPSEVRIIIVGTHKGLQGDGSDLLELLRDCLAVQLGRNVYDKWVREQPGRWSSSFVAIENSQAMEDPGTSGLEKLDSVVRNCLSQILQSREAIPLRWLAVVEKLRRMQGDKCVLWSRKEVEEVCKGFPGFPADDSERTEELRRALVRMTSMTGIAATALFELGSDDWVLSVFPERLVEMLQKVFCRRAWKRYLKQEDFLRLDRAGTLSEDTLLSQIWGRDYSELEKRKILDVFCRCDLIIRLRNSGGGGGNTGNMYGIPLLFKRKKPFLKSKRAEEVVLEVVTRFDDAIPSGLRGGLMAYLCRTVHEGGQDVEMVGQNSTVLTMGARGRVIVEFKPTEREIAWTCIGRYPVQLAKFCVTQLNSFLNNWAHPSHVHRESFIRKDCGEKDCGKRGSIWVDFEAVWKRKPDHVLYCRECSSPRRASEVLGELWRIADADRSKPFSQQAGLIPVDLLEQISARLSSGLLSFGEIAVGEACKGLSRVLELDNDDDISGFKEQLRQCDARACENRYKECYSDGIPCFAISYEQQATGEGRFKFSEQQWGILRRVMKTLLEYEVKRCRIWLDQCLWLRDAQQDCWAETGVLPYILWPVIALGDKKYRADRTSATFERMWPFIEEVSGLWSLGVITGSSERGLRKEEGCREWLCFNHRQRLEPEASMRLLLLNIYHGATESLKTGWVEDVIELQEMAKWNVESGCERLIVGAGWRLRLASSHVRKPSSELLLGMALERWKGEFKGEYLEGSKKLADGRGWHGFTEWMSGNGILCGANEAWSHSEEFVRALVKINVNTGAGEFQLLGFEGSDSGQSSRAGSARALWLLVAMDGPSFHFSRGKVKWTKVLHGGSSCILRRSSTPEVIELVLCEQLGVTPGELDVVSVRDCTAQCIEWT